MLHILISPMLQVAFHRGVCLVLSSLLSTSMIYLKLISAPLPDSDIIRLLYGSNNTHIMKDYLLLIYLVYNVVASGWISL